MGIFYQYCAKCSMPLGAEPFSNYREKNVILSSTIRRVNDEIVYIEHGLNGEDIKHFCSIVDASKWTLTHQICDKKGSVITLGRTDAYANYDVINYDGSFDVGGKLNLNIWKLDECIKPWCNPGSTCFGGPPRHVASASNVPQEFSNKAPSYHTACLNNPENAEWIKSICRSHSGGQEFKWWDFFLDVIKKDDNGNVTAESWDIMQGILMHA